MKLSEFDFYLPQSQIAQEPMRPRDHSRLLVVFKGKGRFEHRRFYDLPSFLQEGDCLVLNDTRVRPARLHGVRPPGGGRVELLLLEEAEPGLWLCMGRPGKRLRPGSRLSFGDGRLKGEVEAVLDDGRRAVRFAWDGGEFESLLERWGEPPVPPYIRRRPASPEDYQTVYSAHLGSAAAPTAGLHFTEELLERLRGRGVETAAVTLHVGLGTFLPLQHEDLKANKLHEEAYWVSPQAAERINGLRGRGGRIVAVGTTSCRAIETAADAEGAVRPGGGRTDLFIFPGYRVRATDALITNFHLPRSSLLALVAAFAGKQLMDEAYREAIAMGYRFYSFGDAMLILP